MKSFICWILLVIPGSLACGQAVDYPLTRDLIFDRVAMKNLRFPSSAQRLGKSVRVYVGFTLTRQGEYRDVAVVNQGVVDESLQQEVRRVWRSLPRQDPQYAGQYVIPIAFLLGEGGPERLKPLSNETDAIRKEGDYKLLDAVSVIGYLVCEKKSMTD